MSIKARLARLERAMGKAGTCRKCGGLGMIGYEFCFDTEPTGNVRGCDLCGKTSEVVAMIFDGPDPPDPARVADARGSSPAAFRASPSQGRWYATRGLRVLGNLAQ